MIDFIGINNDGQPNMVGTNRMRAMNYLDSSEGDNPFILGRGVNLLSLVRSDTAYSLGAVQSYIAQKLTDVGIPIKSLSVSGDNFSLFVDLETLGGDGNSSLLEFIDENSSKKTMRGNSFAV